MKFLAKFKHVKVNTHIENSSHIKKKLLTCNNNMYGITIDKVIDELLTGFTGLVVFHFASSVVN